MGTVSVVIPPDHTTIVELENFKAEIGVTDTDDDVFLASLLSRATSRVEAKIGRPLLRAQYRETLRGSDRSRISVIPRPIASVDSITYKGSAVSLSEIEIDSRDGGILYRNSWTFTDACENPNAWAITSTAGWFVLDDNLSGSISVAAVDKSYNSSALFPTHLKAGDLFYASGFTSAANNGPRVAVTATTSKITVANTLVDEAANTRALAFANMPGAINLAITEYAKSDFLRRTQASGGILTEETVSGATTLRYSSPSGNTSTVEDTVDNILFGYMDL